MKCIHCTTETGSDAKRFCSKECMRWHRNPERYIDCLWCGEQFYKNYPSRGNYCTASCAHKHQGEQKYQVKKPMMLEGIKLGLAMKQIVHDYGVSLAYISRACKEEGIDYNKIKKGRNIKKGEGREMPKGFTMDRSQMAKALREHRNGRSFFLLSIDYGTTENRIMRYLKTNTRLGRWRKATKGKKNYRKVTESLNLTATYTEAEYTKKLMCVLKKGDWDKIEREVLTGRNAKRRCDFVLTYGFMRFAVEAKCSTRTLDVDTCMGQALLGGYFHNATPVCCFPSELRIDLDTIEFAQHSGVILCNESNINQVLFGRKGGENETRSKVETIEKQKLNAKRVDFWINKEQRKIWQDLPQDRRTINHMMQLGFTERQCSCLLGIPIEGIGY